MSLFSPASFDLHPAEPPPTDLAGAVMNSLGRPLPKLQPWGPVKSWLLAWLSFGGLPLLVWPARFGDYATAEHQQFSHLTELLRSRGLGGPNLDHMQDAVDRLRPSAVSWVLPGLIVLGLAVAAIYWLSQPWITPDDLIGATYGHGDWRQPHGFAMYGHDFGWQIFLVWAISLSIAYGFHWLQVRQHIAGVRRLVEAYNAVARQAGAAPVQRPRLALGLQPGWMVGGLIGLGTGCFWAVPAALAGAVQCRYLTRASRETRGQLARSALMIVGHDPHSPHRTTPVALRRWCSNNRCHAALAESAAYCPRCGTKVKRRG